MMLIFLILVPSLLVLLLGLCIADSARRWESMTEEEKADDYKKSIW